MHVALTGASGFIGSRLVHHLHQQGHTVTALVRATSRRDHIESAVERFVVGNHDDTAVWDDLLEGADCIIHNSVDWEPIRSGDYHAHYNSNLLATLHLIHKAMPRQFIFMSTIAVHHDMRPRWQCTIDEDHPLRPGSLYGAYKAAVEDHLWAMHFSQNLNFSAIRPSGVYGVDPDLPRSHGYDLINKLRRGEAITKSGGGKFVHVDDVAAVTVACVGNPDANAKVINLADCYARWADWAFMACQLLDIKVEIDASSPEQPRNMFTKDTARALGVPLDRGHEGIRQHLRELIDAMG